MGITGYTIFSLNAGFGVTAMIRSSVGNSLSELPDDWKRLTHQSTIESVQTNLYAISENEWAVVSQDSPFILEAPTYTIEDQFSEFSTAVPHDTYPAAFQSIDSADLRTFNIESGYWWLVGCLVEFWLRQGNIEAQRALYRDGQLSLTLSETHLSSTLKEAYYRQLRQVTLANEYMEDQVQQVINDVEEKNSFTVDLMF